MNHPRPLREPEKVLLMVLLASKPSIASLIGTLNDLRVTEMNDGGMGSLLLIPKGASQTSRSFGEQLVLGEITDSDGVPVSVALNADRDGNLYELDVWKVDFSPLLTWPDPASIRIVG